MINRQVININAGQTLTIPLPEAFNLDDSMFSVIHANGQGNINIVISNANGKQIENNYLATPLIPLIIAFKPIDGLDEINEEDFFSVDITPTNDLNAEFSFGKGYPKDYVSLFSN